MRNREITVRHAGNRVLQCALMTMATMALLSCSSFERNTGRETTAMTSGGGTTVSTAAGSLPMCNASDNRAPPSEEESACTAADNSQSTIVIKLATEDDLERGVSFGQTFFCQCGDANLRLAEPGEVAEGKVVGLQSIAILSLNDRTVCVSWSLSGNTWVCDRYVTISG
jgi:hypothetical protein